MNHRHVPGLSDHELLSRIEKLTQEERRTTLLVLIHLNEVERRRLHLNLGFRSLFDYCTRKLSYSASAAGRRIQTARAIRGFPALLESLHRGEVNLSTVSLVASILNEENFVDLLNEIRNKSQREVEAVVAGRRPQAFLRDRIRPICVRVAESSENTTNDNLPQAGNNSRSESAEIESLRAQPAVTNTVDHLSGKNGQAHEGHTTSASPGPVDGDTPKIRLEQRLMIQFSAGEDFMKKFNEARSLLSNRFPHGASFADVFEAALDEFLERHSPARRKERRDKRLRLKAASTKTSPVSIPEGGRRESKSSPRESTKDHRSRQIPAAVRDEVFVRDGGRCTYVGPSGERCGANHGLTLDHVTPFARGGRNTAANLRLLCAQHNVLEAERIYGMDFMRRYRRRE